MVMQNISHRYSPTFRFSWAFSNGVYFHIFQGGFLFSILLYVIQTKWYSASRSVSFRANFNSVIDNSVNLSSAAANVYLYGSGFCWSYLRTVLSWEATIKKCPFIFHNVAVSVMMGLHTVVCSFTGELFCGCFYPFCLHLF